MHAEWPGHSYDASPEDGPGVDVQARDGQESTGRVKGCAGN